MRGLAAAPLSFDLTFAAGEVLDRRLRPASSRPVAVALSGGGDSLALTLAAAAWTARAGRRLLVLNVDHRLRPESMDWTALCAATAARLGAEFRSLTWTEEKPAAGLPAAARAARHRLLADAAREAGARAILMGHTADDVLEARRMRLAGASTPEPREWGPSPAWPQGRGVFLLRPLLNVGRGDIRDWLASCAETWIDDPANDDLAFARSRARRSEALPPAPEAVAAPAALARACEATDDGRLTVSRAALREAPVGTARRFVAIACLCASGTSRPPASARVRRLADQLRGTDDLVATLAGARIEASAETVDFLREGGEAARGGLAPVGVDSGSPAVWDGRFEVFADRPLEVRALAGGARRLSRTQRAALRALPPAARRALPAVVEADGRLACPILTPVAGVTVVPLAHARLLAACGVLDREPL